MRLYSCRRGTAFQTVCGTHESVTQRHTRTIHGTTIRSACPPPDLIFILKAYR